MDQVHAVCRRRHLSPRTEEAYRFWIRQFIFFHGKRHPRELLRSSSVSDVYIAILFGEANETLISRD